jgi:predicted nucleic acid-binding protein
MFLLDTHVVTELRKAKAGKADHNLVDWARNVHLGSLFLSAITVLELEVGILRTSQRDATEGARLRSWMDGYVTPAFHRRVLPIDLVVAQRSACLLAPAPNATRDSLIAATALTHGMTVVTRNIDDFLPTGVLTLNPWVPA